MATEATIVEPQVPNGSLISFNFNSCDDSCLVVSADTSYTPASTDYKFQLPLYETGTELLALSSEEISLVEDFDFGTLSTGSRDFTGNPCPAPDIQTLPVIDANLEGLTLNGEGRYFIELDLGSVSIDYSTNYLDDVAGQVVIRSRDLVNVVESEISVEASDADTSLFYLSDDSYGLGSEPDLLMISQTECDGTDERSKYDIDVDRYKFTRSFFEQTFTATDNTFYRLTYKLAKTSASSVQIIDSDSVVIFEASSDGVGFDKIWNSDTLPVDKTITVRFQIEDSLTFPDSDWNVSVLTEVQLFEMCSWACTIETSNAVNVGTYTETHDFAVESIGNSYHPNIEYSYDVTTLSEGCYQTRAVDGCDPSREFVSNCISVCTDSCNYSAIESTLNRVVCAGAEVLDYVAYPTTTLLFSKVSFQDLTIEEESVTYRRSDGYFERPYGIQHTTEVMQIWPLPGFGRQAIALMFTDTFSVDGVEYQKLDDDAFTPLFNAVYEAPMRVLVSKVGDFVISRR